MTRTVKKLEVPRPLKSTTSSAHNRNSVLDVKINSGKILIRFHVAVTKLENKDVYKNSYTFSSWITVVVCYCLIFSRIILIGKDLPQNLLWSNGV